MPRTRELSQRELTVALLARQLLLDRRPMPAAAAVRRLVALQAQYAPSPHVALHSRLDGFAPAELERALRRGTVVKATLMRGTLHLVHGGDHPAFASAWGAQATMSLPPALRHLDEPVLVRLRTFLVEPRTTDEIRERVVELLGDTLPIDPLNVARCVLPLVHVPPSGDFRQHGKFSLRLAGSAPVPDPEATALLVGRYLAAYGPATREDIAHFTYLRLRRIDAALATLTTRRFTDADGRDLLDVPRGALPREDVATPARLLARWDAALLSHKDRTRILPAEHDATVRVTANADLLPTYLVDGLVAGTWAHRATRSEAVLELRPLTAAPPPADVAREAARMLAMLSPDVAARRVEAAPPP